jgi:hypothetical protein
MNPIYLGYNATTPAHTAAPKTPTGYRPAEDDECR